MILFKKKTDLENYLQSEKNKGQELGFVPTMGAIHQGHLSLIESSRKDNSITVCSIFVNPTQFNDPKDFEKYPVTTDQDILLLEPAGCDVLFMPGVTEIYPDGTVTGDQYDLGYLESILEGKYRPGHFQGVCKVVHRLLDIVKPGKLYLGQKDYQQCRIIAKLVEMTGMAGITRVIISPTVREPDGLAMSSRNMRLNKEQREKAPAIYQALNYIKANLQKGSLQPLKKAAEADLLQKGFRTDYIELAAAADLQLVNEWDGKQKLVALAAVFLDEIRLIDNLILNE
jgi:pantoate--beta-alanine ligase